MAHLKKAQKEALLSWVAEGLETDEINKRAARFGPPFEVKRANVAHYRRRRQIDIEAIKRAGEMDALTEGLARKEIRVQKLQQLGALLEADLFGGFLWLEQVKAIGSGPFMKEVEYEEFNAAEVKEYRGVLDDIAKEMGHRKQEVKHSGSITMEQAQKMTLEEIDEELRRRGEL